MHCTGGPLYKIVPRDDWQAAQGELPWAPIDRRDGFVHLSAAHQIRGTAAKHFADREDLVIVEVDPERLVPTTLRWEVSRGGDLFPHVYGDVPRQALGRVFALSTRDRDAFPAQIPAPLPDDPDPDAVARRLEIAGAANLVRQARASGVPWAARGTAAAADLGRGPTVRGWGVDAASADDLDVLLARFEGGPSTVVLSSHAPPDALGVLAERGFRAVGVENVLVRAIRSRAGPAEGPVEGAKLATRIEHELVVLTPRGRGPHLAAIEHRLSLAHERGCRFAELDAAPGDVAHRSALQAGFHLAYVRTIFAR